MANVFTRVPQRPVPRLPTALGPAIAVADIFMVAMISRPATGSLRDTWVTPGTLALCASVAVLALALGLWRLLLGSPVGLLGLLVSVFAAAVVVVGTAQRLAGPPR